VSVTGDVILYCILGRNTLRTTVQCRASALDASDADSTRYSELRNHDAVWPGYGQWLAGDAPWPSSARWRMQWLVTSNAGDVRQLEAVIGHALARAWALGAGPGEAPLVWLQCAVLAHNMIRWTSTPGGIRGDDELTVARTIRTRLVAMPGRLVNRSGRPTLRLPTQWPWRITFTLALQKLRGLAFAPG